MTRPGVPTSKPVDAVATQSTELSFFNNNFDLLRIFAATQVLIVHSCDHLSIAISPWLMFIKSFPGVPIFFVTSGFLISASYQRSATNWAYARNRFRRIFPALWVALLITALIVGLLGYNILSLQGVIWLPAQCIGLIYTPGFLRSFGFGSYNGALWTIPLELQFYVALPILCYFISFLRHHMAALWVAFFTFVVLAVLARLYAPSIMGWDLSNEAVSAKLLRYSFVPHFFLFLGGALAYRLSLWAHPALRGKALAWIGAVLVFGAVVPVNAATQIIWYLLLAGCTISAAYTCIGAQKILRGQDISYGVYIYHGLVLNLLVEYGAKSDPRYIPLVLLVTYIAAFVSWHVVEKPGLKLKLRPVSVQFFVRRPSNAPVAARL